MNQYILSLDEGTTSARAIILDRDGTIRGMGQYEISRYYPKPGWVEQDPEEIWRAQMMAVKTAIKNAGITPGEIVGIGITNQRETTLVWDRDGKPLYNAIVWQCRRTSKMIDELGGEVKELIKEKTGLIPDAYFSATKIAWLLDNVPLLRDKMKSGKIMCGTVDSFLMYRLIGKNITDFSNASRTMLFNINNLRWDDELLEIFGIPEHILPEVRESSEVYGYTHPALLGKEIPVSGDAGDQQAALFGQACFEEGMVKSTYGTGNFILVNTGEKMKKSENLLTTIGWKLKKRVNYALEGSVFITGSVIKWLRDHLNIIENLEESEKMARRVEDNMDVYFVPAFTGLGSPYWDQYARGLIIGLTEASGKENIVRAALESIAYLTRDVIEEMEKLINVREIRVDGGATKNDFLMEFQADILGKRVIRPKIQESTALGSGFLAGLAVDFWDSIDEIAKLWRVERIFEPSRDKNWRDSRYSRWKKAVLRSMRWANQ